MEVLETANIITIQDSTTNKAKQDRKIPDNYLDYKRRTQGFLKQQRSIFLNNQRNRSYRGTTSETHAEEANEALKDEMAQGNSQKNMFKISTHNIRGINRTLDQDNILQELKEHKIDILGLSETKLTYETAKYSFKDQNEYKTFHACNDESHIVQVSHCWSTN